MDEIAAAHNKPVAQVAINWSAKQEFVGTALCGLSNAREAKENCATFEWSLSDEEFDRLNKELERWPLVNSDSFIITYSSTRRFSYAFSKSQ